MPHPCQAIRMATYGGSAVAFSDDALYNERGGKAGTALLTAEPEAVVPILLSVSPEAKFTYQPYLTFLSSEGWATERAKFPEELLAACSLRLLVLRSEEHTSELQSRV